MLIIYYVASIQRSGTHMLKNMIFCNYKKSLYKNDCGSNNILRNCIYSYEEHHYTKKNKIK